ncbi:MAG: hypothetical protein EXS52_00665 [Candidatus Staskawiczbacteria bacterium]|nr:hypothetical protein [Candidatus Staskawiczbacteria bacterium]
MTKPKKKADGRSGRAGLSRVSSKKAKKRPVKRAAVKKIAVKKQKKVLAKKKTLKRKRSLKKSIKKVVRSKIARKVSMRDAGQEAFSAKSFFKAKIKVIGIGGGGGSIVSEIGRSLNKASFVIADTDVRAFKKRRGIKYFLFGQELTHGLGTGLNTDLARRAAQSEAENISKLFKDQDIVIFVACLGGGLGSGATQIFAEATKNFDGIAFGIFTLPFKFEGKNKHKIASKALRELRNSLNVSITIPNEKIFKVIDSTTAITDAFSMVNRNLIESLESLIDLIYNPGVINIDFADVRAILKGRGNLAFLNTAEASGKDRADTIIKEILHNPLYQNNNFIAEKVLFNIAGGGALGMFEVDKISRVIASQNPKAKIIFGISKDTKLKNKIKTTLLMTGPGVGVPVEPVIEKVEKPVVVKAKPKLKKVSLVTKKVKKVTKSRKPEKKVEREISQETVLIPVLNPVMEEAGARKLAIAEATEGDKKAIRRSALEIKRDQEMEENKKSQQEKEWEIPAFLRKIKIK